MQQRGSTNGPAVVVLRQPGRFSKHSTMSKSVSRQLIDLGIAQAAIGVFCIIIQSIILGMLIRTGCLAVSIYAVGIWTGIWFIVVGAFGIWAGIGEAKCKVVAFNILSIISFLHALVLLIISSVLAHRLYYLKRAPDVESCQKVITTVYALEIALVILAMIEIACAVWSSVVCCAAGACCCACGCDCCDPLSKNPAQVYDENVANQQQPAVRMNTAGVNPMKNMMQQTANTVHNTTAIRPNLAYTDIDFN